MTQDEQSLLGILSDILNEDTHSSVRHSAALEQWLRRHHMRPLANSIGVPGLTEASQECALISAFHSKTLQQLGDCLVTRGIPWTLIKGAAYSHRIYSQPAHRPMSDLDVLVADDDFLSACTLLKELGFQERKVSAHTRHAQTFFRSDYEIVDLHRSILQPWRSNASMTDVWKRAVHSDRFPGFVELELVDLYCIHLAHMARHEFVVPLVSYIDLHRMLQLMSEQEHQRRQRYLRSWRLEFAQELSLLVLDSLSQNQPSNSPDWRAQHILPTQKELVHGSHQSRVLQLRKKLLLFPRDALLLASSWAVRRGQDYFKK